MRIAAFDFETELIRGTDSSVCTIHHVPRAVCLAVATSEGESGVSQGADMVAVLRGYLESGYILVGHNVPFDIGVSIRLAPELRPLWREAIFEGRVYDTRVMYQLRHVPRDTPRTLKQVVSEVLRVELEKGEVRTSFTTNTPLTREQIEYALSDAVNTLKAFQVMREIPLGGLTHRKYEHHVACVPRSELDPAPLSGLTPSDRLFSSGTAALALNLAPNGLAVSRSALDDVRAEYQARVHELSAELARAGLADRTRAHGPVERFHSIPPILEELTRAWAYVPGCDVFARRAGNQKDGYRYEQCPAEGWKLNQKALRAAHAEIAKAHNLDIATSPETGQISLKYDEWKLYKELLPPPLRVHLDLAKARKYLSAFLDPLASACVDQRELRVYPSYWIPGAETTRWSCSRPNTQQLPKPLRKLYVADPGEVFVYADYSTLELYTLAHCMHTLGICGTLMKQLERGADIHTASAAMIYNVPESEVTPAQRQTAKALNFGLPGGLGIKRLYAMGLQQYGLTWTEVEAEHLRTRWFEVFSDVALFLMRFRVDPFALCPPGVDLGEWIWQELRFEEWPSRWELGRVLEEGQIYTVTLPTGLVLPRRKYTQAANSVFQATGAAVITRAFLNCVKDGLDLRAVVHDSITVAATPDQAQAVGARLTGAMQDALKTVCPTVPSPLPKFEVGPHLM